MREVHLILVKIQAVKNRIWIIFKDRIFALCTSLEYSPIKRRNVEVRLSVPKFNFTNFSVKEIY